MAVTFLFFPVFWLWRYVSWVLILLVFLFGNFIFVFISNSFDAFKHADYPFIVVTFQSTFLPLLKCSMSQCCNLFYIANVWILWCVERKKEQNTMIKINRWKIKVRSCKIRLIYNQIYIQDATAWMIYLTLDLWCWPFHHFVDARALAHTKITS